MEYAQCSTILSDKSWHMSSFFRSNILSDSENVEQERRISPESFHKSDAFNISPDAWVYFAAADLTEVIVLSEQSALDCSGVLSWQRVEL